MNLAFAFSFFWITPILVMMAYRLYKDRDKGTWLVPPLAVLAILASIFITAAYATASRNVSPWWLGPIAGLSVLVVARRRDQRELPADAVRWRFSLGRMMLSVAMFALIATAFAEWIDRDPTEYLRLIRTTDATFRTLFVRMPPKTDPVAWTNCAALIQRGYFEGKFDNTSRSLHAMAEFDDELKAKLKGPVNPKILQWSWDRLTRIVRSKQFLTEHEEEFQKNLKQCAAPFPAPPK